MFFPTAVDDSLVGRSQDALKALESGAYISALCLALTLPDICASRAYPDVKCGERYARWFDEYVSMNYMNKESNADGMDCYFDGDDCYQLRCVFLHEGINAPHIERKKTIYHVAQFRIFKHSAIGCDHILGLRKDEENFSFNVVDLDLRKFIRAIKEGVDRFIEEYPECNKVGPFMGPESIFYNPILDFSASGETQLI